MVPTFWFQLYSWRERAYLAGTAIKPTRHYVHTARPPKTNITTDPLGRPIRAIRSITRRQALVNDLATKLKALAVEVGALGDEYKDAAIAANDASEEIRGAFRKSKNKETKKKRGKSRQPLMYAFLKPQKK